MIVAIGRYVLDSFGISLSIWVVVQSGPILSSWCLFGCSFPPIFCHLLAMRGGGADQQLPSFNLGLSPELKLVSTICARGGAAAGPPHIWGIGEPPEQPWWASRGGERLAKPSRARGEEEEGEGGGGGQLGDRRAGVVVCGQPCQGSEEQQAGNSYSALSV